MIFICLVFASPLCIHLVLIFRIHQLLIIHLPLKLVFFNLEIHSEAYASCLKSCHNGPHTVRSLSNVAFLQHSAVVHKLTF